MNTRLLRSLLAYSEEYLETRTALLNNRKDYGSIDEVVGLEMDIKYIESDIKRTRKELTKLEKLEKSKK